jgi:hypothetical protein
LQLLAIRKYLRNDRRQQRAASNVRQRDGRPLDLRDPVRHTEQQQDIRSGRLLCKQRARGELGDLFACANLSGTDASAADSCYTTPGPSCCGCPEYFPTGPPISHEMTPLPVSVRTDSLADDPVSSEPFSIYAINGGSQRARTRSKNRSNDSRSLAWRPSGSRRMHHCREWKPETANSHSHLRQAKRPSVRAIDTRRSPCVTRP